MFSKTKTTSKPDTKSIPAPAPQAPELNSVQAAPFAQKKSGPTPAQAQGSRGFSSIGSGLIVEGNLFGTADLVIDGTVRGDVKVGHLTIGENGNVEGKVEAESIQVRGRVIGSILGKTVHLQSTAYVEGDISHDSLSIETGAFFQGRCLQNRKDVPSMSSAPAAMASASPQAAPLTSPTAADASIINPFAPQASPAAVGSMSNYDLNSLTDLK